MGLKFFRRRQDTEGPVPTEMGGAKERYNAYFPRLFAYVRSCVGGDMPAQEIMVQAFYQAFRRAGGRDEDRFRTVLFRSARRLCRPALQDHRSEDGDPLNASEREVISLVFDAGLTREQIARLFRIRPTTVSSLLMAALRKLKEQTSAAAAPAYLKLA